MPFGKSVTLGFFPIMAIVIFIILLIRVCISRNYRVKIAKEIKYGVIIFAGLILTIAMSLDSFPWNIISTIPLVNLLSIIQFPWRMLAFSGLVQAVGKIYPHRIKLFVSAMMILIVFNTAYYVRSFNNLDIKNKDQAAFTNHSDQLYIYHNDYASDMGQRGNIVTCSAREYSINDFNKKGNELSFEYRLDDNSAAGHEFEVPVYYYPGYKAYCNGTEINTFKGDKGALTLATDDSSGRVEVRFEAPFIWHVGYVISGAYLLILIIFQIKKTKES